MRSNKFYYISTVREQIHESKKGKYDTNQMD